MRGKEAVFFGSESGLASEMIRNLFFDRSGTLWVATFGGGLSSYRGGRFTNLRKSDGLPDDHIKAIAQDRSGAIWIGTYSGGASRIAPDGKITNFGKEHGLPSMIVFDILADRVDSAVLSTAQPLLARRDLH
jgi:ligand-binding sensor domain-containing protein